MAESDDPDAASDTEELSATARERLADLVELQPTKNADLGDRWGLESGSDVHAYLEGTLGEYYYRDEDSLIRATAEAVELVGGEALPTGVTPFEAALLSVLPGPEERSASVVATLQALRSAVEDATDGADVVDGEAGADGAASADDANGAGSPSPKAVGGVDLAAVDPEGHSTEEIRRALRALARKGLVEVVQRTVPTFRLKRAREELSVEIVEPDDGEADAERTATDDGALEGPEDGPSPDTSAR